MQGVVRVLNDRGHTEAAYDTETGVVEEAEAILAQAAERGAALFSGTTKEKIGDARDVRERGRTRDVLAENEEVLVVPPVAGG